MKVQRTGLHISIIFFREVLALLKLIILSDMLLHGFFGKGGPRPPPLFFKGGAFSEKGGA